MSTTNSSDANQEITAGNRLVPITNEEWNQQTTVDARNVLQTQQSIDVTPAFSEQRSMKSRFVQLDGLVPQDFDRFQ